MPLKLPFRISKTTSNDATVAPVDNESRPPLDWDMASKRDFISVVREFSEVEPVRAVLAIVVQWAVIAITVFTALQIRKWVFFGFAGIVIATRQHAMAILVHEAVHYRLFRRRWVNDLLSNYLLAYPLGISTAMYRSWHFRHHRFVGSAADPEYTLAHTDVNNWGWPGPRSKLIRTLLADISGRNFPMLVRMVQPWSPPLQLLPRKRSIFRANVPRNDIIGFTAFSLLVLALIWRWPFISTGVLALWILSMCSVTTTIVHIRSIAEHLAVEGTNELNTTRTVRPTWLERLLIAPFNVNYHLEHHMFPSVPWYNLNRLNRFLMRDEGFRSAAHITITYLDAEKGLIGEITHKSDKARQGVKTEYTDAM